MAIYNGKRRFDLIWVVSLCVCRALCAVPYSETTYSFTGVLQSVINVVYCLIVRGLTAPRSRVGAIQNETKQSNKRIQTNPLFIDQTVRLPPASSLGCFSLLLVAGCWLQATECGFFTLHVFVHERSTPLVVVD